MQNSRQIFFILYKKLSTTTINFIDTSGWPQAALTIMDVRADCNLHTACSRQIANRRKLRQREVSAINLVLRLVLCMHCTFRFVLLFDVASSKIMTIAATSCSEKLAISNHGRFENDRVERIFIQAIDANASVLCAPLFFTYRGFFSDRRALRRPEQNYAV